MLLFFYGASTEIIGESILMRPDPPYESLHAQVHRSFHNFCMEQREYQLSLIQLHLGVGLMGRFVDSRAERLLTFFWRMVEQLWLPSLIEILERRWQQIPQIDHEVVFVERM